MFFCFSFVYIDNQIDVLVQVYVCFFFFFSFGSIYAKILV